MGRGLMTPIEAERQRLAQEQHRRSEAAKAVKRRPLEELSAHSEHYFLRIRNAAAGVNAFNRDNLPGSRPLDSKALRPSWNASPRFPTTGPTYDHTGEPPATPDPARPVPPGRERPREQAPRRGVKARAAEQGGFHGVHLGGGAEQTPVKNRY